MKTRYLFGEVKVSVGDRNYIEEKIGKIEKLLNGYDSNDELLAEVEANQDKRGFWKLEIMIKTPHNLYRVEKKNNNLTEAMDEVEEVLKKQIRRDKEKVKDLRQRGNRSFRKAVSIDEKARF
jgi:ribosomal subunit interface protein